MTAKCSWSAKTITLIPKSSSWNTHNLCRFYNTDWTTKWGDWLEELYQKLQTMKENYLPDPNEIFQKFLWDFNSMTLLLNSPSQIRWKLRQHRMMLKRMITILLLKLVENGNVFQPHRDTSQAPASWKPNSAKILHSRSCGLIGYNLNVDLLDVYTYRSTFHRFGEFNLRLLAWIWLTMRASLHCTLKFIKCWSNHVVFWPLKQVKNQTITNLVKQPIH